MFNRTRKWKQIEYPPFAVAGFWRAGYRGTIDLE